MLKGGLREIDIAAQVQLSKNIFRLTLPEVLVSIVEDQKSEQKMRFLYSRCEGLCEHIGAAISLALEEKTTLGTCKHILFVINNVRELFPTWKRTAPFMPSTAAVYLTYGNDIELRMQVPENVDTLLETRLAPYLGNPVKDLPEFTKAVSECTAQGMDMVIYPDAEQYINIRLHQHKLL